MALKVKLLYEFYFQMNFLQSSVVNVRTLSSEISSFLWKMNTFKTIVECGFQVMSPFARKCRFIPFLRGVESLSLSHLDVISSIDREKMWAPALRCEMCWFRGLFCAVTLRFSSGPPYFTPYGHFLPQDADLRPTHRLFSAFKGTLTPKHEANTRPHKMTQQRRRPVLFYQLRWLSGSGGAS
jgi:hypothetical protein